MTEMVTTEVPRVGSVSPYTIRKEKVFDYEFFYRDSIQRGEGRVPIPVQKVSTQELHQLELSMITEDRTIPIGGASTPTTETTI
jgi:hypothetical protein